MTRTFLGALLLASSAMTPLASGAQANRPASPSPDEDAAIRRRADALLAQMIPEEKAGQLTQYFRMSETIGPAAVALNKPVNAALDKGQVGSLLFVTSAGETNALQRTALEHSRLKIPLLFGLDVIHGLNTIFPVPIAMAATWDPALAEQAQAVAAREARAIGVHWTFAPMVDIAPDARWGRIVEGAGEDPYLGAAMAAAQVRGFQGDRIGAPGHIIAGVKHFAAYGASVGGRDYDQVDVSDADLWNVYFPPFKAAVDAGAGTVMSAYMPLNGVPAAGNHFLLTDVLRKAWGFKGLVVSDAGGVASLKTQGLVPDYAAAALRAVKAGVNMEMVPPFTPATMGTLPAAVAAGRLSATELDDAVRPVLEAKIRMGLFEHPFVDEAAAAKVAADRSGLKLARSAAERAAVLLRNDGGVLPLDRARLSSVAVIGPLAASTRDLLGSWTVGDRPTAATSILDALRATLGKGVRVDYSPGVDMARRINPSPFAGLDAIKGIKPPAPLADENAELARAVTLAQGADVAVLVLGESQEMSGEAASRASFDLPGRQQALLDAVVATGKPTVVVLMTARPLNLHESKAAAILNLWYPGSAGGEAAAALLLGEANPGGKLPITWGRSAAQSPASYLRLASHDAKVEKRYWDGSNASLYPFGFGLSYTTFAYDTLRTDKPSYAPGEPVTVTVNLKNTGARAGDEVAQLYIHQRWGTSARPVRELKGFQRVALKAGETRALRFTLAPEDLRYWSAATRDWVQDEAAFDIWIGGDSTAKLAGKFELRRPR